MSRRSRIALLLFSLTTSPVVPVWAVHSSTATTFHFHAEMEETSETAPAKIQHVRLARSSPGDLVHPQKWPNQGSWQFDGRRSIVHAVPSNSEGFAERFTWEGFFLSPSSNTYLRETGIADRLITQFAFDNGNWTRLAIGLVADAAGEPRLSVELEGFEGRTFALGDRDVSADKWHHFALVHEGTAAAATIRWYLDYRMTGELFLGGQSNQNTLRPPGTAQFTIGARLQQSESVNRGFEGLIDEVRLVARPLRVKEFLRVGGSTTTEIETAENVIGFSDINWNARHHWARNEARRWAPDLGRPRPIDAFFDDNPEPIDDAAFLRRLSLAVRGRIPAADEAAAFLANQRDDKRIQVIDCWLASPEWADHWVGYWQDVLAENPSVVLPTLNNSGAFRDWIYDSFRDNKPFDRFATELILMAEDSAGFALATGNDSPMAMKAHVIMQAFAAIDLKCARCHDSPVDDYRQADLFRLAAYLNEAPLKIPATSVAAIAKAKEPSAITTSLVAGQEIPAVGLTSHWLNEREQLDSLKPVDPSPRAHLAALVTSPRHRHFSAVLVNRVWKRYFGTALVEPVDRWNDQPTASNPALLHSLSAEFVNSGYDLQALTRRILTSKAWQSRRVKRSRMSAEQLVDSLFFAVGKDFQTETLGVHATDPGAVQLPRPRRAWQFAALPNERDRPALGMPVNQTIVDVMTTFGWKGSRQQPRTDRDETTTALQPLMLFNGIMSQRIARLSDQSAITDLCLEEQTVSELIDQLFLTVLSRHSDATEQTHFHNFIEPVFEHRRTGAPARPFVPLSSFQPDWRKHLEPEQTRLMLDAQQRVASGEAPTRRLTGEFRERIEDILWALINSPEFVVIP